MGLFDFFKKLGRRDEIDSHKTCINSFVQENVDPFEIWGTVGELGDGAFGKVYKAQHRINSSFAAMKKVTVY